MSCDYGPVRLKHDFADFTFAVVFERFLRFRILQRISFAKLSMSLQRVCTTATNMSPCIHGVNVHIDDSV